VITYPTVGELAASTLAYAVGKKRYFAELRSALPILIAIGLKERPETAEVGDVRYMISSFVSSASIHASSSSQKVRCSSSLCALNLSRPLRKATSTGSLGAASVRNSDQCCFTVTFMRATSCSAATANW
jgi:hypothetical protein